MKFATIFLSALFLATIWLASSSASRHPRQLRVPLPLPTTTEGRRKSGLFPKMNAKFVVTERAHKMAATVKMAPMKRTNALLPNLSLKNKITGDRSTKRMTSGPAGIAIRPVLIRRFNLTKPSAAVTTTNKPALITRRPLAKLPTHTNMETKVTKETQVLSTTRPITKPSAQVIPDNKNGTDKHLTRPQAMPFAQDEAVAGSAPVKPIRHYSNQNSSKDKLIVANKQQLVLHPSQDVTMKTIPNVTENLPVVTTKREPVTPATQVKDVEEKDMKKEEVLEVTTKGSSTKIYISNEENHQEEGGGGTPLVRVKRLQAGSAFTANSLDSSNIKIKRQLSSTNSDMPDGLSFRDWLLFRW